MKNIMLDKEQKIISISNNNPNVDNLKELREFFDYHFLINIEFDIVQGCAILFFSEDNTVSTYSITMHGTEYFIDCFYDGDSKIIFAISILVSGNIEEIFRIYPYDDNGLEIYMLDFVKGFEDSSCMTSQEIFPNILGAIKFYLMEYKFLNKS